MNNFLFENGTRVLFGGGCVQEYLGSFVKGYGPNVLLITEEGDHRSGAADEVRDILRRLTLSVSYLLTKEDAAHAAE